MENFEKIRDELNEFKKPDQISSWLFFAVMTVVSSGCGSECHERGQSTMSEFEGLGENVNQEICMLLNLDVMDEHDQRNFWESMQCADKKVAICQNGKCKVKTKNTMLDVKGDDDKEFEAIGDPLAHFVVDGQDFCVYKNAFSNASSCVKDELGICSDAFLSIHCKADDVNELNSGNEIRTIIINQENCLREEEKTEEEYGEHDEHETNSKTPPDIDLIR